MKEEKKNSESISIIGFILSFFMPIVALILSIIGLSRSKKNESSKGFAVAGLVISIISILIKVLLIWLFFSLMINEESKNPNYLDKGISQMCEKAQKCEPAIGNLYNCLYKNGNVSYTVICPKDKIPENIFTNKEYSLSEIEEMAVKYYEKVYNQKLTNVNAIKLEGNQVEIKLYSGADDSLSSLVEIYTINDKTLIGKNSIGERIDLSIVFESKNNNWKKVDIENNYDESTTIELDLNGDNKKEKINIMTSGQYITINNKDYVINKYYPDNSTNHFKIVDLNDDGKLEIIHRTFSNMTSPITNKYTIFNYDNNDLKEISNFSIIGSMPDEVYVNGNIVKFNYWPYESPNNYTREVIFELAV